jgi:hypothetical protein
VKEGTGVQALPKLKSSGTGADGHSEGGIMRRLVLGMSAAALVATAAWAADQQSEETQVAALNRTWAAFARLDADQDGRISALEATNDPLVAAAFTDADLDHDGYLSKEEFANLMRSLDSSSRARAQARMATRAGRVPPAADNR